MFVRCSLFEGSEVASLSLVFPNQIHAQDTMTSKGVNTDNPDVEFALSLCSSYAQTEAVRLAAVRAQTGLTPPAGYGGVFKALYRAYTDMPPCSKVGLGVFHSAVGRFRVISWTPLCPAEDDCFGGVFLVILTTSYIVAGVCTSGSRSEPLVSRTRQRISVSFRQNTSPRHWCVAQRVRLSCGQPISVCRRLRVHTVPPFAPHLTFASSCPLPL